MSWELVPSGNSRYGNRFGSDWSNRPAIAVAVKGILCNELFKKTFSLRTGDNLNVFFDSKRYKIGFQRPTANEAALVSYKIREEGKNLLIICTKAAKKFDKYLNKAFPATLNATEKIIEVQLS